MNPTRVCAALDSLVVLLPAGFQRADEATAPAPPPPLDARVAALESKLDALSLDLDRVRKAVDDVLSFNRIDTREARASRAEVYVFLAKHLKP